MTKRIFRSIMAVSLSVLLASLVLIVGVLYGYFQDRVTAELAQSTAYIARGVESQGMDYLSGGLPEDRRITWIGAGGEVLFDNWQTAADM